jgi:rhodanese-related sulfurtransferase
MLCRSRRFFSSNVVAMIDKETLKKRLEVADSHPLTLIDVREPHELIYGAIPRSINIPQREIPVAFGLRPGEWQRKYGVAKPGPESEIVFYCRAGPRALNAAQNASVLGYNKVICYFGSFLDWSNISAKDYPPPTIAQNKQ